jgi:hypothetical protein
VSRANKCAGLGHFLLIRIVDEPEVPNAPGIVPAVEILGLDIPMVDAFFGERR